MFLKSVKARGFKSFARPVEFAFEPGIAVVVGPNGSGKSNIADAVVWAMGEQSPTAVRGSSMQDIIFSGSDNMSPSGMAEVEILFDNSSGALPIDFSEVLVSRRLYRDGEGSYYINKTACRLIDVGELLSDAGLGRDSHSIVSQGKVDSILESRPEERRAHIEEAAGLGKFKKRRRRAEHKLEAVRRNLERLADVEEEVQVNLRPLRRQATAAERSAKLDRQIATTNARSIKGRRDQLNSELEEAQSASKAAVEERRQLETQLAETAEERRSTEEMLAGSLQEHKRLAARFYSLKSKQESLAQRQQAIVQRRESLRQAGKRAVSRIGNLEGQIERVDAELSLAREDHQDGQIKLAKIEAELEIRKAELAAIEEEWNHRRQASEEKTRKIGELSALKDRSRHQVEYLSQRRQKLAGNVARISREMESENAELDSLAQKISQQKEAILSWQKQAGEARSRAAELGNREMEVETERQQVISDLRGVAEDLKIAKARLTFLGDSDRDRSGLPLAAKQISEENDVSTLIDLVDVEPGYERAVSAVMGSMLFALPVADISGARDLLDKVRSAELGSIEFLLPGEIVPGAGSEGGDLLLSHVKIPAQWVVYIEPLLADVQILEDESELLTRSGKGVWVTRGGVVFQGGKRLLSYKADPPSSVVLKHRNERKHLELERRGAEGLHNRLVEQREKLRREHEEAGRRRHQEEADLREICQELSEAEDELAADERRHKVLEQALELKHSSLAQLNAEADSVESDLDQARKKLEESEKTLAGLGLVSSETHTHAAETKLASRKARLEKQVTDLQIDAARVRERALVAGRTIERVEPARSRLRQELDKALFQVRVYHRFEPACSKLLTATGRLTEAFNTVSGQLSGQLKEGEDLCERHSASLRELSQEETALQQKLSRASDTSTDCEVGVAKLRDQVEELVSRLSAIEARFPDMILEEIEAASAAELDELEYQIERLVKRREQIGPVNPLAQQEYEEMLERKEFLAEQRKDLENSLQELNSLIKELTERIESTFAETFETVRRNFADVVATLFPGGEGRMTLVEPEPPAAAAAGDREGGPVAVAEREDLTEEEEEDMAAGFSLDRRGIEISVKPARKTVRSLSLLSGGERSLVAVAFLFAIFLARPAPFYILDEVEAALDDTNIDRLLNMLREYQDRTQFIVITHQKRTMEVADVLYGVTMAADGTSKILSRRMSDIGDDHGPGDHSAEAENAEPAAMAG